MQDRHEDRHARAADTGADDTGPVAATEEAGAAPWDAGEAARQSPGAPTATGALADEPRTREDALRRLRKIEGQVRGLQRMVEDGRYCADVLTQISSVQQALRAVGKVLMRTHLEHCITDALRSGDAVEAERAYGEVLDLMYRHVR